MALDAIVVGGGIAGSTIAGVLARRGHDVLVLEREADFKDRVRGENMLPWGVDAARRLGVLDSLLDAGAHQPPWWTVYAFGNPDPPRDLRATTPHGNTALNMYHPHMQQTLLAGAMAAGAQVRRGASVLDVETRPAQAPVVTFSHDGREQAASARVVIGADGRTSQVRRWGGFDVQRDPDLLTIAGVLVEHTDVPEDAVHLFFGAGAATLLAPLGGRRARVYYVYPGVAGRKGLSGSQRFEQFKALCQSAGAPAAWLNGARAAGPLAEFDGADRWVAGPAKNGVALVGDAAASTDPSWGCGLSLALTDVEHLADALCTTSDWDLALQRYAARHDEYYDALHRVLGWMTELMWTPGPEADARRARVLPRMGADPRGFPDTIGLGPFGPCDEQARRLVLGLEDGAGV